MLVGLYVCVTSRWKIDDDEQEEKWQEYVRECKKVSEKNVKNILSNYIRVYQDNI